MGGPLKTLRGGPLKTFRGGPLKTLKGPIRLVHQPGGLGNWKAVAPKIP